MHGGGGDELATQVGAHPSHPAVQRPLFNLHHCSTVWMRLWSVESRAEPILLKKTWLLRGDQDGGSSGHLLCRRNKQVREKAIGDLQTIFRETFPQAFTRIVKAKVF